MISEKYLQNSVGWIWQGRHALGRASSRRNWSPCSDCRGLSNSYITVRSDNMGVWEWSMHWRKSHGVKGTESKKYPCSYVGNMEFSWNRVEFQLRWTLRICLRGECFLLGCLFSSWRQSFDVGFIGTWLSQYGLTLNVEHWVLNNDFSLFIPWFLDDKRRRPLRTSKTSEKTMQDFDFVLTLLLFRHDLRRLPTEFQSWWWPTSKRWLPYVIRKCRLNTDT